MRSTAETHVVRLAAVMLYTSAFSLRWDIYNHHIVGRETLWSPPHLSHFIAFIIAILACVTMWHKKRTSAWRDLSISFLFFLLIAPFDDLWHRLFAESPWVMSNLTPPHLFTAVIGVFCAVYLLKMLRSDPDATAQYLLSGMMFAVCIDSFFSPLTVFIPLGKYHYLGFWGAGIIAMNVAGFLLYSQRYLQGFAQASLVMMLFLVLTTASFGADVPGVVYRPYNPNPSFLVPISFLLPAVLIDLLYKYPLWLRGATYGFLYALVFYTFSYPYLRPEYFYTTVQTVIAVVTSLIGGLFIGLLIPFLEKHFFSKLV